MSERRPTTDGERESSEARRASPSRSARLPSSDRLLAHLSRRRCRLVLHSLHERGETLSLDELAEIVAGGERAPGDEHSPELTRRTRVALVHTDLPRLADEGLIDYDDRAGSVALAVDPGAIEPYLRLTAELVDDERTR